MTDLATSLNEATLNGSMMGDSARARASHQQMANAIRFLAVDAVDCCKGLATFLRRMKLSSGGQRGRKLPGVKVLLIDKGGKI